MYEKLKLKAGEVTVKHSYAEIDMEESVFFPTLKFGEKDNIVDELDEIATRSAYESLTWLSKL